MDPSKFFNRKVNIRNPKTPYGKGKFIDESKNYSNRISSRINQTPLTKSLFSIRKNLNQIQNTLTGILGLNDKSDKQKKKFELIENQEEKSKKKIKKSNNIFGNIIERPKTGALGLIRDFLTFTFLGWLFTRLQPLLSGLGNLVPLLKGVSDFIGGTVWFLVDMLGSFVKFGYDAIDNVTGLVDNIKQSGKNLDKHFDDTLIALKDVFGGTIELVNSFLAVSVDQKELNSAKNDFEKNEKIDNIPPLPPLPKAEQSAKEPLKSPDSFSNHTNIQGAYTGGVIRGYADGGNLNQERIDPRSPITRGVQTKKKETPTPKPIIQPQQISPGKDIGGEKKIRELYDPQDARGIADFIPLPSFFRGSDKKSGFSALIGVSEELKKPNQNDILGIGSLMAASVSVPMGQKVEKRTYSQFAQGIKHLVNYGMTQPDEFAKIDLEDMIKKIIEPKVNLAINKIQEEINKKSKVEEQSPSYDGPGGDGGGISAINLGEFSPEDIDALGRMVQAEAGGESSVGKAAVLSVILNRYRAIKSGLATPGQFNIRGKTKDQVTLRDILFAGGKGIGNQFSPYRDGSFDRTSSAAGKSALADAINMGGADPEKLKENLIKVKKLSEQDAEYVVKSLFFSNPESRQSNPGKTREVSIDRHNFQQSRDVKLGSIGKFNAEISSNVVGVPLLESSQFGEYRMRKTGPGKHEGIDLVAKSGKTAHLPVIVKKSGVVIYSGYSGNGNGIVSIKHSNGVVTRYIHLNNLKVKKDQTVSPGQIIGRIAAPGEPGYGTSRGSHLHFEWWPDGKNPKNPKDIYTQFVSLGGSSVKFDKHDHNKSEDKPGKQNIPSSPPTKPSSSTLPGLSDIGPRPGESSFLIKGKMYYVDLKTKSSNGTFVVRDQNNKKIKVGKGVNEWLLKEIQTQTNLRPPQKVSFTPTNPPLNANTNKLAYENSSGQSPIRREIQPIIYKETIPVPVSFGTPFVVSSTSGQISSNIQPLMKS